MTNTSGQLTDVGIQQFNISYVAEQDRLLFKVGLSNNNELSVWFTYRIARMLWQLLSPDAHIPSAKPMPAEIAPQHAVKQFEQEVQAVETLKKMDFKTPYTARTESVSNQPMLVSNVLLHSEHDQPKMLDFACLEGLNVRINLNAELVLAICNMLQMASKDAVWNLSNTVNIPEAAPALVLEEHSKVLH